MRRPVAITLFVAFIILMFIVIFLVYEYHEFSIQQDAYDLNETYTVANWNIQTFGDKKSNSSESMQRYASTISRYDIVFVQEIRDKDSSSFYRLCDMLPQYSCNISSRAGRSPSKEQYGLIYLKSFNLTRIVDYNPDSEDRWERPPVRADFAFGNYLISFYNIHTKPNETAQELSYLDDMVVPQGNIAVLGDLNAGCGYYPARSAFMQWHWVIPDAADTTAGYSQCAYDRIILDDDSYQECVGYGIDRSTDSSLSDHYLVWARMRNHEYWKDKSLGAFFRWLL